MERVFIIFEMLFKVKCMLLLSAYFVGVGLLLLNFNDYNGTVNLSFTSLKVLKVHSVFVLFILLEGAKLVSIVMLAAVGRCFNNTT